MPDFIEVAAADFKDGEMRKVLVEDKEVLVARVGPNYYATQDRCQHLGGDLSMGKLEGTVVTCPRHHSQYDLKDGHVVRWTDWTGLKLSVAKIAKSPRPLKTYEVRVEGGKVLVASKDGTAVATA
jgi:3-phenylpropionate/trans-cinnamate dioxygenase ferredoxin subunit